MRWRRDHGGLILPDRELVPPSTCSMLMATQLIGFGAGAAGVPRNLFQIITDRGHTMDACFDIAEGDCFDGSAQDVFDLTANNVDFWRGADNTTTTDDWTFVGTADDLSSGTYAEHDGGDFSRAKAQPAFIQAWHKAGAAKTALVLGQFPDIIGASAAFGTEARDHTANVGIIFEVTSATDDNKIRFTVGDATTALVFDLTSTAAYTPAQIVLLGIAINEAGGATASTMYIDGTSETFDGAYTTPSAGDATNILEIGAAGAAVAHLDNLSRIHACAFIDGVLTGAQFDEIRDDLVAEGRI